MNLPTHRRWSLAAALAAFGGAAAAHDLWLEKEADALTLYQGHRHSAHAGAETLPYQPGFVKFASCIDGAGGAKPLPLPKTTPWRTAADCAVVLVTASSGYWTKTPWETRNVPKDQVAGAIRSWRSEESLKRLDRWIPAAAQALGEGLELVPLANPLGLKPDAKVTLLVTENGRPRAGVPVAYGGDPRGITGEDGRIAIRLRHGGTQLISASTEAPLADGKADLLIRSATLQFDLPK